MRKQTDRLDHSRGGSTPQASVSGPVTDPVCHMEISREDAVGSYVHEGQEYFFCNPSCLENFRANPSEYLSCSRAEAASAETSSSTRFLSVGRRIGMTWLASFHTVLRCGLRYVARYAG